MKPVAQSKNKRYTDIPLPQAVVHYCREYGIKHIVISAGSRNAPLTNGFVEDDFFVTYSIVDERAAAFFALGIAQQFHHPAALVCTSGSALLNYYPAVAEAFYSELPLVILSADRMPHRIDIGDGQTIKQEGVFGPHLIGTASLKPDVAHATAALLDSNKQPYFGSKPSAKEVAELQEKHQTHNVAELQRVLQLVCTVNGPVHLNIPMEEPLYGMTTTPISFPKKATHKPKSEKPDLATLHKHWEKAGRKMILIGTHKPNTALADELNRLAEDPTVLILTEKTSNYKHPKAIGSIDCLMAPLEHEQNGGETDLQPELILTLGGMIVSKKIKFFLRKHKAAHHLHIGLTKANDTFYYLSHHLNTKADQVLRTLEIATETTSTYQEANLKRYHSYLKKGIDYLKTIPFSDLKVFEQLAKTIPADSHLQIANSSPIRYAQLFAFKSGVEVYGNRGTAGIDGSMATAMGAAQINNKPLVFITGDLSFFYDVNGLWHNYIPKQARIIIINNQGGGIFRILPGEKDSPKYDTYFETIHNRSARHIAKGFGLGYKRVCTLWGTKRALRRFFHASDKAKILEICTPRKTNDSVLLEYFKYMANKKN